MADAETGTLFLVVGPSGAGKDTLIDAARGVLEPGGSHVFPAREITRPADAGGEAHRAVSPEEFGAKRAAGGYALSWNAHGLDYGIDAGIAVDLAAGRHVVCNVSRAVVDAARAAIQPLRIVVVTASLATLAQRIAARGRESLDDAATRLARASAQMPAGPDVTVIVNDGALAEAVAQMIAALTAHAPAQAA
jgi:phosphonate metabolism protein PhnN/1,5-bisphosphokinase (PRPP-forming)